MEVKHEVNSIPITSSELSYLWNTYIVNSKAKYIFMHTVGHCNDKDICSVFKLTFDLSSQILDKIKEIFNRENQIVPYGFSENDVYMDAPKIYSDKIMLYTLKNYVAVALTSYGTALSLSPRQDIRKFFTDTLISSIELSNKVDDILLEKGIYLRIPTIPTTQKLEFAEDKSIMGKIIGHNRPLTASEVTSIFNCSMAISCAEAHILGFAQIAEDTRLRDNFNRVKNTLKEQAEALNKMLSEEGLFFPPNLESEILTSTEPAYSDRLCMLCATTSLGDVLTTLYIGKLGTMRKDVSMTLTQISNDIVLLIKDATDLMLERKWFEEMPKNIDREIITK